MSRQKNWILTGAFMLVAASAMAENRNDSLFARLDRPATVAGHNAPNAFAKYLDKMNENKRILTPSEEGSDPFQADVWVLFFQNERELRKMPGIIQDLYDGMGEATGKPVSRYVEFQLSNGLPKAASFHLSKILKRTVMKSFLARQPWPFIQA